MRKLRIVENPAQLPVALEHQMSEGAFEAIEEFHRKSAEFVAASIASGMELWMRAWYLPFMFLPIRTGPPR